MSFHARLLAWHASPVFPTDSESDRLSEINFLHPLVSWNALLHLYIIYPLPSVNSSTRPCIKLGFEKPWWTSLFPYTVSCGTSYLVTLHNSTILNLLYLYILTHFLTMKQCSSNRCIFSSFSIFNIRHRLHFFLWMFMSWTT